MGVQQIGTNDPDGARLKGFRREIISGEGATRTLLAEESGALCLFDRAAGIVYTLPAPSVGLEFEFLVTLAGTSNAYSVDTDATTTFLDGAVAAVSTTVAEGGDSFVADGTHVSCDLDSDVTGRLVGSNFKVTCVSATVWTIEGVTHGVGTLATPFA